MGPGGAHEPPAAASDAERERLDAALRAGWVIRFDPVRLEFTAAWEVHVARTLPELLGAVEALGPKAAP